jgi:hypothetical protein
VNKAPTGMTRREEMRLAAASFHAEYPEVWELFVRFTLEKIRQGFKHYGAKAVMERVRWESDYGANGIVKFKVNDHYTAFYARRFTRVYPQYVGFFRNRIQKSHDAPATYRPEVSPEQVQ